MNAVQQSQGIENFFDNLFGFMRRKTDFFSNRDQSRGLVIKAFEKSEKLFDDDKIRQELIARKKAEEKAKKDAALAAEAAARKQTSAQISEDSGCVEVTDEEARQIELEEAAKKAGKPLPTPAAAKKNDEDKKEGEEGAEEEKGIKPNHMNGSTTDKYNWG